LRKNKIMNDYLETIIICVTSFVGVIGSLVVIFRLLDKAFK